MIIVIAGITGCFSVPGTNYTELFVGINFINCKNKFIRWVLLTDWEIETKNQNPFLYFSSHKPAAQKQFGTMDIF